MYIKPDIQDDDDDKLEVINNCLWKDNDGYQIP